MMKLVFITMVVTMTSAFAADEFGGVKFHSSVEKHQTESLKKDLRYLYTALVSKVDADLISVAEVQVGDGPNMHNWLLNRVKYIVGESFQFNEENILQTPGKFPSTPLADKEPENVSPNPDKPTDEEVNPNVVTVMSNVGGALYLLGKENNVFLGLKFDGQAVLATSPRTGILQVGEGLFMKEFLINKNSPNAAANSVHRLATLFHEARHSDGNSKHTSFPHIKCPKGHPFVGAYACETSGNGSYSIGAIAERHLIQNCTACSFAEKSALSAGVADSFFRIIDAPKKAKISRIQSQIASYNLIIDSIESLKNLNPTEDEKVKYSAEINQLKTIVDFLSTQIIFESVAKNKPAFLDPTPEGEWKFIGLKDSMKVMKKSLK